MSRSVPEQPSEPETRVGGPYANYVLGVLALVYVFNFLDRQILSILNERIKADLGLDDAQMGFLYGTAFAVFYAIFGIPLGRLADVWNRRSLIAVGLTFWSVMTALSGLSRNFFQIASARIGVGVGEASASPAAYSILSDYFPPARRATALAVYSSGIYIGSGLGLLIGGQVVERWNAAFPAGSAPAGLAGWQVAFFVVGLPGLLLALWVRTLREPLRGQADGISSPTEPHPFRAFALELRAVLPIASLYHLWRVGGGSRGLLRNVQVALVIGAVALALIALTGHTAQWVALGIGFYAAASWMQTLHFRDAPTAELILRTKSLRYTAIGFACLSFTGYGIGYWTAPYFIRMHGVDEGSAGPILGAAAAAGGWLGVTLGGLLADACRRRSGAGRLYFGVLTAVLPVPLGLWLLLTDSVNLAFGINFPLSVAASMWIGAGASTIQDLVLPHMRATASAFYLLVITFIGLALGPYTIGVLSDSLGNLRSAMLISFAANAVAVAFLLLAARHVERDEASLHERARRAGQGEGSPADD